MNTANEKQDFAVHLYGEHIGMLHRRNRATRLILEESYIENADRAVLGLIFEQDLYASHKASMRLPPWFSNLLPEGVLRDWIAEDCGVKSTGEMELLAHVGHDLPGAVQVLELDEVKHARRTDREVIANKPRPIKDPGWRFSLAGVGLKFPMLEKHERFTAPGVGEGGDWIIKLPNETYPAVPLNEFAMMTLARECGIEVPEIRLVDRDQLESVPDDLWPSNERQAYAIRRFDRDVERKWIHIEDLAQVRNWYPDFGNKYKGSFETVAALIYRGRDLPALLEFTRRLAFNILIGNGDAHLKNWSLIYRDKRIPTLSPVYDLVATSVYRPRHSPEDMGLKFCGDSSKRFENVSWRCFDRLAKKLDIDRNLSDEVEVLVERVLAKWPRIAEMFNEHPKIRSGIDESITRGAQLLRKSR